MYVVSSQLRINYFYTDKCLPISDSAQPPLWVISSSRRGRDTTAIHASVAEPGSAHQGVIVRGLRCSLPVRSYGILALAMLEGVLVTPEALTLSTM